MTAGALALALIAGVLSVLSPCVLPILPVVLGAAASEHRWGPAVLAIGLSVSFVAIGLFAATVGYSIGLDAEIFRRGAAALMVIAGTVLLVPRFQEQLALAGAPLANWSDRHFAGTRRERPCRSTVAGAAARRGLEPLCRPDARSGIDPGGAGPRSRRGCGHDAGFRAGRGPSACRPGDPFARRARSLARAPDCRWGARQGGLRRRARGDRPPRPDRSG